MTCSVVVAEPTLYFTVPMAVSHAPNNITSIVSQKNNKLTIRKTFEGFWLSGVAGFDVAAGGVDGTSEGFDFVAAMSIARPRVHPRPSDLVGRLGLRRLLD